MTGTLRLLPDAPDLLDWLTQALEGLTEPPANSAVGLAQRVTAMDVLSDVLRVVRLSGAVFFTAEFSSPWALESKPELLGSVVPPDVECVVRFHILTEGECVIECRACPGGKTEAAEVIAFPYRHLHTVG